MNTVTRPLTGFMKPTAERKAMSTQPSTKDLMTNCASFASLGSAVSFVSEKSFEGQLDQVCKIIHEEMAVAAKEQDVNMIYSTAEKIICAASSDSFGVSGRLAYKLRDALRSMRSSSFAALGPRHRLIVKKLLSREAERRKAQLSAQTRRAPAHLAPIMWTAAHQDRSVLMQGAQPLLPLHPANMGDSADNDLPPPRLYPGQMAKPQEGKRPISRQSSVGNISLVGDRQAGAGDVPLPEEVAPADAAVAAADAGGAGGGSQSPSGPSTNTMRTLWYKAFAKYKDDGQIHKDDVALALEAAGFPPPDEAVVEDAFRTVSEHYNTLSEEQWIEYVNIYIVKQRAAYKESFLKCDNDNSGSVEVGELKDLLKACGIEPMNHVLDEVLREVDTDGTGSLEFQEFERLMELIRFREGFSAHEFDDFMALFRKFDRDGSGEIDTLELQSILNWLGYQFDKQRTINIVTEVDANGSGTINDREFVVCMRKVREQEIDLIRDVIRRNDTDGDGTISREELPSVLVALGYLPEMKAVWEAARDGGIAPDDSDLDLGELWQLLTVYRLREGFMASEMEDIKRTFARYDNRTGEISQRDLGQALRALGHPTTFELLQQLVCKVDVDGSGSLNLPEFRKLVRMYQSREMELARDTFLSIDQMSRGYLTFEETKVAMERLHCVEADGQMPSRS